MESRFKIDSGRSDSLALTHIQERGWKKHITVEIEKTSPANAATINTDRDSDFESDKTSTGPAGLGQAVFEPGEPKEGAVVFYGHA